MFLIIFCMLKEVLTCCKIFFNYTYCKSEATLGFENSRCSYNSHDTGARGTLARGSNGKERTFIILHKTSQEVSQFRIGGPAASTASLALASSSHSVS